MKKSYALFLAVLMAGMAGMSACYGPFNLTKKLWSWNGTVGTKWVNEAVFLGLVIVPVYQFASLGDAVIFNSIQFWTGNNPVTAKNTKSIQDGDKQAVMNYDATSRRLRIDSFEKGRHQSTVILKPSADGMVATNAQGQVIMSAKTVDGEVVVADASGKVIKEGQPQLQ